MAKRNRDPIETDAEAREREEGTAAETADLGGEPETQAKESPIERAHRLDDERSLKQIREVLGSNMLTGGKILLNRRGPGETRFSYVTECPVNEFDIEWVRKTYGGGDYKCQTTRSDGGYYRTFNFAIDGRAKGIADAVSGGKPDMDLGAVVRAMKELAPAPVVQKDNMELFMVMMKESQAAAERSAQMQMTMMQGMFTALAGALGGRKGDLDINILLPLLLAKNVTPEGGKGHSLTDMIAAVKTLKELAEPDDKGGGFMESLAETLPSLLSGFMGMRNGAQAVPARPAPLPQERTPAERPAEAVHELPPADAASPVSKPDALMAMILSAARNDYPTETYVNLVLDLTPEDQVGVYRSILTGDSWFAQLFGGYEGADALKPWLTKLRNQLLEALEDDGDPPGADAGSVDPQPAKVG